MCGICGVMVFGAQSIAEQKPIVRTLTNMMKRRGPDAEGFWSDQSTCAFGFRRLSILDLSAAGNQPMETSDGRHVIVYNGEMYNFQELKRDLEQKGIQFRSASDTEVVLYALREWGNAALGRFNGMFALAFFDQKEKRLLLARDHAGIKPLYYRQINKGIVFASQYDQILAHPWKTKVNSEALGLYLRLGYIPAPYALHQNTLMLEAGTWLEVDSLGRKKVGRFFEFPVFRKPDLFGEKAYEAVDDAISQAVKRQLVSDVPVGTFLSGGIDSPLIAAKAKAVSAKELVAFTLGTNGDSLDETADAALYAQEIEIRHIVENFNPAQAFDMLEEVVASCSEPFADHSIFPTLLISKLARRQVSVMLSGDGGDELFWGYAGRFASVLEKADDFSESYVLRSARWGIKKHLNFGNGYSNLRYHSIGDLYRAKHSKIPEALLKRLFPDISNWPKDFKLFNYRGSDTAETAQWLRWNEYAGHLNMVLLKVDRASMYHSLEVRVPLLDKELINIASRTDWQSCLDVKDCIGKLPLRQALSRHVTHQTKTKRGFEVPINEWLKEPLRQAMEDVLINRKALLDLPLNQNFLKKLYQEHIDDKKNHSLTLWTLLSLALWENRYN